MISTRNLSGLPAIVELKKLTQSLAMLEAILQREWEHRYYSFDSNWAIGEQLASMRNGEGDGWFCVFSASGAILKGFDHESRMSPWNNHEHTQWPGLMDNVPVVFNSFAKEPAFSMEDTTFCIWRLSRDPQWHRGNIAYPPGTDPDGSDWMLSVLDGRPNTYRCWAEEYYERPVSLSAVEHIYSRQMLTNEIIRDLSPDIDLASLADEILEMGYPAE